MTEAATQAPTIQLAGDRVLLKLIDFKTGRTTKGGIALPDTYDKREDAWRAEVIGHGPGFRTAHGDFHSIAQLVPGIEVGARVVVERNTLQEQNLELGGEKYIVVRSAQIVGVVHGE